METRPRIAPDRLLDFAAAVFVRAGMPEADARLSADTLVQADLWGHQSHGVMRLSWYVARLLAGVCEPVAAPESVVDAGAVAVMDGKGAMGQVLTARAVQEAIRRAKAHGVGAVALRDSNHFGTAMYFTLMAARAGCVAFLSTDASPAMAPWGGRAKTVGTNPWSWAAPAGSHPPFVLDIANTGVARGKIYLAKPRSPTDHPGPPGGCGRRPRRAHGHGRFRLLLNLGTRFPAATPWPPLKPVGKRLQYPPVPPPPVPSGA